MDGKLDKRIKRNSIRGIVEKRSEIITGSIPDRSFWKGVGFTELEMYYKF